LCLFVQQFLQSSSLGQWHTFANDVHDAFGSVPGNRFSIPLSILSSSVLSNLFTLRTFSDHRNEKKSGRDKSRECGRCAKAVTVCLAEYFTPLTAVQVHYYAEETILLLFFHMFPPHCSPGAAQDFFLVICTTLCTCSMCALFVKVNGCLQRIIIDTHMTIPKMLMSLVTNKNKSNSVALVREQTVPTEWPPLVCEVSANFCRILDFLNWSRYYFFQVATQLYWRGWMDPVPDPLLLRKSGSAENRTQDLWDSDH
jgi:hypothetical protein